MHIGNEGQGKGVSQSFELNLAPVIDCMTVLITFMLASASFLSIGILEAGAGLPGEAAANQAPPDVNVQLELLDQNAMEIKLSGKSNETIRLPSKQGELDFEGLARELTAIKGKWPHTESMVLSAANDVEYRNVIQTMEKVHTILPGVLLGGF